MTRERFNDIIRRYSGKLLAIAVRITGDRQEAEDIVQDVFLKMWTMGTRLDEYNDPEALAVTMVRNKCIDAVRKRKFIDREESTSQAQAPLADSPHDELVSSETGDLLMKIIADLPGNYRDILVMRDVDGLSYEEISKATELNINSIRVAVSRARQLVKAEYIKQTYERGIVERAAGKVL